MKKILISSLLAFTGLLAAAGLPSSGGVSVDFTKKKAVVSGQTAGADLVGDGRFEKTANIAPLPWSFSQKVWYSHFWVHMTKADGDYRQYMKQIRPFLKRSVMKEGKSTFVRIESSMEAWKFKTAKNKDVSFSNQLQQYIHLPESAAGKRFEITFRYRGVLKTSSSANSLRGFLTFADGIERGKLKNLPGIKILWIRPSAAWRTFKQEFEIPAKAKRLHLNLALYGPGNFDITDVRISEIIRTEPLKSQLYPQELLDGIYTLGEKSANLVTFTFSNPGKVKLVSPEFELKLPAGFTCTDSSLPLLKEEKKKTFTVYTFDLSKAALGVIPSSGSRKEVLIRSVYAAGGKLYPAWWRTVNNKQPTPWQKIDFKIMPRKQSSAPKRYKTGLYLVHQQMIPKEQSKLDFFKDYADAGFNFIQGWFPYKGKPGQYLKKRNIIRSYENWFMSNAYHFGSAPKPENARFRLADGKPFVGKGTKYHSICPTEIIEKGPYFRSEIKKIMVDPLTVEDSCDTMMVNHEPFVYNGKGCFCSRCREAFIAYLQGKKAKFDLKAFRSKWPGSASAFSEEFIRFCSLRHAQAVRVFNQFAMEAGKKVGKKSSYIPEINWVELEEQNVQLFRYYSALDYMKDLPILEPWGPYLFHNLDEPYIYTPGYHLITWGAAKAVKGFLSKNIADPRRRPQIYAFPHGNQSGSWFTEPEAIVFDSLCYFLHKWEGSIVYLYNMLDYKYFSVLADMNALIACHEDLVLDGKERSGDRVQSVTPIIGAENFRPWLNGADVDGFLCIRPEKMVSYIGKENALRLKSFTHGQKILAAVGNFWQRGESFFNLKLQNLDPKALYTVRQLREKRNFGTFSGAQLMNKGVLLHVGALRFAFYVIEKGRNVLPGETKITQKELTSLMHRRLPLIRKAYAAEKKQALEWEKTFARIMAEERSATAGKQFDFSVLPSVSSKGVTLAPSGKAVAVTTPDYSLKFHPSRGGIITDLVVRGKRLDAPLQGFGIAMDTLFGQGGVNIDRTMRLESVEPVSTGVKVTLVRKLSSRDSKLYQGVILTKNYIFTAKGFTTSSEFRNGSSKKLVLTVRQHNFAPNGTKDPLLTVGSKKFPRDMKHKVIRIGAGGEKLIRQLKLPVFAADGAKLSFSAPWSPAHITAEPLGKEQPALLLIWEGGASFTAEYIYPEKELRPKESATYRSSWKILVK